MGILNNNFLINISSSQFIFDKDFFNDQMGASKSYYKVAFILNGCINSNWTKIIQLI